MNDDKLKQDHANRRLRFLQLWLLGNVNDLFLSDFFSIQSVLLFYLVGIEKGHSMGDLHDN